MRNTITLPTVDGAVVNLNLFKVTAVMSSTTYGEKHCVVYMDSGESFVIAEAYDVTMKKLRQAEDDEIRDQELNDLAMKKLRQVEYNEIRDQELK